MSYDPTGERYPGSQHDRRSPGAAGSTGAPLVITPESVIEQYDVRPPNADAEAESLSGGNQQSSSSAGSSSAIRNWSWRCTRRAGSTSAPRSSSTCSNCGPRGRRCFWSPEVRRSTGLSDRLAVIHEGEFTESSTATAEEKSAC